MANLPPSMRALVVKGPGNAAVESIPVPKPGSGSVTVRILHVLVYQLTPNLFYGTPATAAMSLPYPVAFGGAAVGRIAAVGPDTTAFTPGQLVLVEPNLQAHNDPDVAVVWGGFDGFDARTKNFVRESWRDGAWAEFVRAPLENTWPLNEDKLIGTLGLCALDLVHLPILLVAYGALSRIDLKAGETVLIAPATGTFSGGAVAVAQALGANVIAAGRNADNREHLKTRFPGIQTIQLTGEAGDIAVIQVRGPIDAFVDVSPGAASESSYLSSCMLSVREGGRISLIGGRTDSTLPIPYLALMFNNITIRGSYMYDQEHVRGIIKLAESGVLKLGANGGFEVLGPFPLDEYTDALGEAENCAAGKVVAVSP
jgi:NADPH:quinone reductase-like Zn-dependent oxidoreductase